MRKYIAELIGTFALTFTVLLSLGVGGFPVSTPLLAALVLSLFVYTIGPVSGSHINPAVTIGLLSIGKVDIKDAIFYIVCQFIGAAAAVALSQVLGMQMVTSGTNPESTVLAAESIGAFLFTFGIGAVAAGRVPDAASGLVVGGSLLLGIATAANIGSAGILNPAVAFGVQSFSVPYVVGPILGAVIGMVVSRIIDMSSHSSGKDRK